MKVSAIVRVLAAVAVVLPTVAFAQIMTPEIPVPGEDPANSWINASFAHVFKADIDDFGNTKMQRESALVTLGHRFGAPESKFKFAAQFSYQLSAYNFYNDGGALWSDVHQFTFLGIGTYRVADDWTLLGGGLFRLAGESDADFSQAITAGGFGGFLYHWTENLSVGVLIGAMSQIEDDAAVVPLPLVNWKMSDAWRFDLGMNQLGGVGYGPKVSWAPSETWDLALIWSYERRRYRLDNSSGPTKNYIGDETSAPLVVQASWHPDPNVRVGAFAGVVTAGNIRMETQGGNKVFDKSYNITPTIGVDAVFRF